jgi:hypothetical protein
MTTSTMIRVSVADLHDRHTLAKFLRFSDVGVREDGDGMLLVDSKYDLDEQAQLKLVKTLIAAWQQTREQPIQADIAPVSG